MPIAEEVFLKGYWIDRIVPEAQDEDLELDGAAVADRVLSQGLYPFDFVTESSCAGLWFDRRSNTWRVVFSGDHGANWTDDSTMSVAEYLAQLQTGLGGARQLMSNGDHEKCGRCALALVDAGFQVLNEPGQAIRFRRGGDTIDPAESIARLHSEAGSLEAWRAEWDHVGLADVPFHVEDSPPPSSAPGEMERPQPHDVSSFQRRPTGVRR